MLRPAGEENRKERRRGGKDRMAAKRETEPGKKGSGACGRNAPGFIRSGRGGHVPVRCLAGKVGSAESAAPVKTKTRIAGDGQSEAVWE